MVIWSWYFVVGVVFWVVVVMRISFILIVVYASAFLLPVLIFWLVFSLPFGKRGQLFSFESGEFSAFTSLVFDVQLPVFLEFSDLALFPVLEAIHFSLALDPLIVEPSVDPMQLVSDLFSA